MNYYEILNVDRNSTMKEITKQYYKLSKIYHPDKKSNDSEKFLKISEAYNILSIPIKRYKYDIELEFSNILNKEINLNLSDDEIILLNKYYSKIRYSTEFRFLKMLFNSISNNNKKKYSIVSRAGYKYIDIKNVKKDYTMNLKLSFEDSYLNICKKIIVITDYTVYYLFVTHTNISYKFKNSEYIFRVNIFTRISDNYLIDNYDIYIYNNISFYDFLFNDKITITLPKNNINIKVSTLEPIIIPLLGLKNPITHIRGKLIINNRTNLLDKKEFISKNISDMEKNILYDLFS